MLGLFLTYVLVFLAVTVALWAGTLVLQGYFYSEPVDQIYWRAPAAALAYTLFVAFWCSLDYRHPGEYNALFDFSTPRDEQQFDKLWAVKKKREIPYHSQHDVKGRTVYVDPQQRPWKKSDTEGIVEAIIVEDKDGRKMRFDAQLDEGKFRSGEAARYVESEGQHRVMTEDAIGKVSHIRWGVLWINLLLNALHAAVWFLCLWVLLRFQWGHAFGLALALWLVLTFILPTLFHRTEVVAKERAAAAASP